MQYGLYLPNFGNEASARAFANLAKQAEDSGWDGFFIWDHILMSKSQRLPMIDPWVTLAAVAMNTHRIRFGTTVTPLPRRRPWKLARETATLDNLSEGRLTLSVGLGEPAEAEFEFFGEEPDPKIRAAKLDEGLEVLAGLWRGTPFKYQGEHYQIQKMTFVPPPAQTPRIPIWVGGWWPNKAPFRRAARWDGVIPLSKDGIWVTPNEVVEMRDYIHAHRTVDDYFDVVIIGERDSRGAHGTREAEKVAQYAEAGATWWLESLYMGRDSVETLRASIQQGPPK